MATLSANLISTEFIEFSLNRVSRYKIAPRSHTALLSTALFLPPPYPLLPDSRPTILVPAYHMKPRPDWASLLSFYLPSFRFSLRLCEPLL